MNLPKQTEKAGAAGSARRKVASKKATPEEVRRAVTKIKQRFAAAIENLKNR